MDATQWKQARELFDRAMSLPPVERTAFLDEHCEADPDVRKQVESLLGESDQVAAGFLEESPFGGMARAQREASEDSLAAGTSVGPWQIVSSLGSGGMGLVFVAEGSEPKRTVALKTLRGLFASEASIQRFRNEFRLLAHLEHPGIARLYDAGTYEHGTQRLPYYTMELVEDGQPITRYAEGRALDQTTRLTLFEGRSRPFTMAIPRASCIAT